MKILIVFTVLLLGFALADEEEQFAKSLAAPMVKIVKMPTRTGFSKTITKRISMRTEFDAELESVEANRWKLQQMIESLTEELHGLGVNLKALEAKQKSMTNAVYETQSVIAKYKLKKKTFIQMKSQIRGYQKVAIADQATLKGLQLQAKRQNAALTLLLGEISAHQKKMKHTGELITKMTALLNKAQYELKLQANEVLALSLKIKAEKQNLAMMKAVLLKMQKAVTVTESELHIAETNVKKKTVEIASLEVKLKKEKAILSRREASLRKSRAILVGYEMEVKKLQSAILGMQVKIRGIKIKVTKLVTVIGKIQLVIGQAAQSLVLAKKQYEAFKRTVAAKLANLRARRHKVHLQLVKITKQKAYIHTLVMMKKQKETKVAQLKVLVTKRIKKLAHYKGLLVSQNAYHKGLKVKVVALNKEIASLRTRIAHYIAKINAANIKIAYQIKVLKASHHKWEIEMLVIEKKSKAIKTQDLELRARISQAKSYIAEKSALKRKYSAQLSSLLKRITILKRQIEEIQEQKIATTKAALNTMFTIKVTTSHKTYVKTF